MVGIVLKLTLHSIIVKYMIDIVDDWYHYNMINAYIVVESFHSVYNYYTRDRNGAGNVMITVA